MRNKKVLPVFALGASLIAGGIVAASLANVTSSTFSVGQATLAADCLNPATADVHLGHITKWESNTYITSGIRLTITDDVNPINCNGKAVRVLAINQWGAETGRMNTGIVQTGNSIDMEIPLRAPLPADIVDKFAVSILTFPHFGPQYSYLSQPFLAVSNNEGLLTWNRVANATNYRVVSDGQVIFEGNVNSLWVGRLPNGTYRPQVQAFVAGSWGALTPVLSTYYVVTNGVVNTFQSS